MSSFGKKQKLGLVGGRPLAKIIQASQPTTCDTCGEDYEEMSGWCKCTRPIKVECKCTCCGAHYDDWIEADCVGIERPVRTICVDCACPATPCSHPPYKEE